MPAYMHPFPRGTRTSQRFGEDPASPYNPAGGHTGEDSAVAVGTPVHAAGDGVIDAARTFPTYENEWLYGPMGGKTLVLNCGQDAPSFGYSHLSRFLVAEGDRVRKGQVIALSGDTGTASTGPHCHTEALPPRWNTYNGTYGRVDPRNYMTEFPDETEEDDMPTAAEVADEIFSRKFPRGGPRGGLTDLGAVTAWRDAADETILNAVAAQGAQVSNLVGAVAALAKGEDFDQAKLLAGVQAAAAAGVKAAIDSIETTVNLVKP